MHARACVCMSPHATRVTIMVLKCFRAAPYPIGLFGCVCARVASMEGCRTPSKGEVRAHCRCNAVTL